MEKYIGIDLGTSSIKATLANIKGEIILSTKRNYPLYLPNENWSEQDPVDWYNGLIEILKEMNTKTTLSDVVGISFSGQMHGMVLLDNEDNIIRNAILWNDQRTTKEVEEINKIENLIDLTGNVALTGFTAPKVLWVKHNEPNNFKKIVKIMLPKDYLCYKMTNKFFTDYSDASGTLYFDVKNKKWSQEMLNYLGINISMLPEVVSSTTVVGNVTEAFSQITGLPTSCKVIIGGGDQAIGAIGTGTINNNQVSISLGTSGVIFASSDNYIYEQTHRLHSFCHANGNYHVMGVTLSAAGSMEWWAKNILKTNDFETLLNEIEVGKINNLIFLPYLMGERSPINDPNAKSELYGLSLVHTRSDITKAIVEGITFSLYDCMQAIYSMKINPTNARVIGGLSKSEKVMQIFSDVLGISLSTINVSEGASLGAIMVAIKGCHNDYSWDNLTKIFIKETKTYLPNEKLHQTYHNKYLQYKDLYIKQKKDI